MKEDCRWISLTSADNAYGSDVVNRILNSRAPADMMLAPLDSKYFAKQGENIVSL